MNHKLFSTLLIIISLFFVKTNAQTIFQSGEVLFMKPGNIKNGFSRGDSVDAMMKVIGRPDDIIIYFFEINDAYGEIYCYKSNEIYVINNQINSISVYDDTIAFGIINKFQLKVGDKIKEFNYTRVDINKFDKSGAYNDFKPIIYEKGRAYNLDYDAYFSPEFFYHKDDRLDLGFTILFKDDRVLLISMYDYDC